MGLPLWQPRVESDIPSRPEAKNPAHARSRIRGHIFRDRGTAAPRDRATPTTAGASRNGDAREMRTRERRRGLLQEMQERIVESNTWNVAAANTSSGSNANSMELSYYVTPRSPLYSPGPSFDDVLAAQRSLEDEQNEERERDLLEFMQRPSGHHWRLTSPPRQPRAPTAGGEPPVPEVRDGAWARRTGQSLAMELHLQGRAPARPPVVPPRGSDRVAESSAPLRARARAERTRFAPQQNRRPTPPPTQPPPRVYAFADGPREIRGEMRAGRERPPWTEITEYELAAERERAASSLDRAADQVNGLGDRDRSPSPALGPVDNDWATLFTTVTPDPQPPSINSSFASFLSSAPTRTPLNESSNTSMTGRDAGAEESALEQQQPCDSDDDDEEEEPVRFDVDLEDDNNNASGRRPSNNTQPSSYADVARRLGWYTMPSGVRTRTAPVGIRRPPYDGTGRGINAVNAASPGSFLNADGSFRSIGSIDGSEPDAANDILQLVGGLGGMQHIMRNLVAREDIPNDWWVNAGLSRTLPRDDSGANDSSNNDSPMGESSNN